MSSSFFDIGDEQRLERERMLTVQAPRQEIQEDRTPDDSPDFDMILMGLLQALRERTT